MAAVPITVTHLLDLARQLSPHERRTLLDSLLAERFETTLSDGDRRGPNNPLTDDEIQSEIDEVRRLRRQERQRAAGG